MGEVVGSIDEKRPDRRRLQRPRRSSPTRSRNSSAPPLGLIGMHESVDAARDALADGRRPARHQRRQARRRRHPARPAHLPQRLSHLETTPCHDRPVRLLHPRHPRRAGLRPDHRRGRSRPSTSRRRSCRTASAASATATSTPAAATRPATRCETLLAALEGGDRGVQLRLGPRRRRHAAARDPRARRPRAHGQRRLRRHRTGWSVACFVPWGVSLSTVEMSDLDAVRAAIRPDATKVVWLETPSNPLMKITDIAARRRDRARGRRARRRRQHLRLALPAAAARARRRRRRALDHQVPRRPQRRARRRRRSSNDEVAAKPRREGRRSCSSASAPCRARWMPGSPSAASRRSRCAWTATRRTRRRSPRRSSGTRSSTRVYYPGLPDHPGHELAARQMKSFGGMISVQLADGADRAQVRRVDDAVPARRVARRRRVAGLLPGRDDARLGARAPRSRCPRTSCACRSASRASTTCSATCSRRSLDAAALAGRVGA